MSKYWPTLEEYKSMPIEQRERHKKHLVYLQYVTALFLLVIGGIYIGHEGVTAALTIIGWISGGVGFFLMAARSDLSRGGLCCAVAFLCLVLNVYIF